MLFAGYRIKHPLENILYVVVSTTEDYSPVMAMATAIRSLNREMDGMLGQISTDSVLMDE